MNEYKVSDIFTPSSPANYTFVERDPSINDDLVNSLFTRGKQIILYGETGTGKTTLLLNKLKQLYENYIITRCTIDYTFEKLLLDAFDQLNRYYTSEITNAKGWVISPELRTEFLNLKAEINNKTNISQQRILPLQLTLSRLSKFIGEIKACWIIEDYHKIQYSERVKLSQAMKVFMDTSYDYPEVRIIATGAVDSPRKILQHDNELENNRLSEIYIPLMSNDELTQIILKGEELLNIVFDENIIEIIVSFANGLPSFVHQLCLNMCFNRNILVTQQEAVRLELSDLEMSLKNYMNTHKDTLKYQIQKAIGKTKENSINHRKLILQSLSEIDFREYYPKEIKTKIASNKPGYRNNNLSYYLKDLCSPRRSSILRYNKELGRYCFSSPILKAYADYNLNNHDYLAYENPFADITQLLIDQVNYFAQQKI